MPKIFPNTSFKRLFPYIGFFMINFFLWLLLMGLALSMMVSCTTSKPQTPSLEELREKFADKDTIQKDLPIEIPIKADSASLTIIPDLLPFDFAVSSESKTGQLKVSATRRQDKSLSIVAIQKPDTVRDTIRIEVPVYRFDACRVEGHLSKEEADKLIGSAIKEDRQNRNNGKFS